VLESEPEKRRIFLKVVAYNTQRKLDALNRSPVTLVASQFSLLSNLLQVRDVLARHNKEPI
jgi:hypothetical protein